MESKEVRFEESWSKQMPFMASSPSLLFNNQAFDASDSQDLESNLDYGTVMESLLSKFDQTQTRCNPLSLHGNSNDQNNSSNCKIQDWDPKAMLSNLTFLEQKIHQLQEIVNIFVEGKGQNSTCTDELLAQQQQQQQLVTADLSSIVVQLVSMASSVAKSIRVEANPVDNGMDQTQSVVNNCTEEVESKDEDDGNEEEHLPPGSYEIQQLEKEEILAPHTHFCTVCGKGFKRDANLRMHMRGHGDEYKTPAALAKPHKDSNSCEPVLPKRYSCPYTGCKRNKEHKKFQALKTILCVKNHYKRTHCDKTYTCSRCNAKKFSVIADLKTHEKHCGREKWLCSCGTTFSRKDKLFGHIALFQGHTPAIPFEPTKASASSSLNPVENNQAFNHHHGVTMDYTFASDTSCGNGSRNIMDDAFFNLPGFDGFNSLQDFSQSIFDDPETPFPFLLPDPKQSGTADFHS